MLANDDVAELLRFDEAPLRANGIGQLLRRRRWLAADLASRVDDVLLANRGLNITNRERKSRHPIRIEPDPKRVVRAAEVARVADAFDAEECVVDVDEGVVGQERRVVAAIGRIQRDDHQRERERLLDRDTEVLDVLRQERLCLRIAIVDENVRDIDVGPDVERDDLAHRAIVRVGRLHVQHAIDAVHLLLDRRRHRLLDRQRVRARVRRVQVDLRRQDLRKLRDRQAE